MADGSRQLRAAAASLIVSVLVLIGCSAGDPPDPEAADTTTTAAPTGEADPGVPAPEPADPAGEPEEPELPEAEDAKLDALEEQFEDDGVKDIRGDATRAVTIRMEDESSIAAAGPACAAVRAAGFSDIVVDVDEVVTPCP